MKVLTRTAMNTHIYRSTNMHLKTLDMKTQSNNTWIATLSCCGEGQWKYVGSVGVWLSAFFPCTNCCVGVFLWTLKFTSETSEDAGDPI